MITDFVATIDPQDELTCLGHGEDLPAQGGSMAPPIVQTSLFAQESLDDLVEGLGAKHRSYIYSRGHNPTVQAVETKLAQLERGAMCKCTSSGMAAVSAVMMGLLESGDHVLFVNNVYGPTLQLAALLERFGVRHTILLDVDLESIDAAMEPTTRMIWLESPGTMLFKMVDLPAVVEFARSRSITTVVDNSWSSPVFQKPLAMGIDVVVHSATKYIGGHSDVVAGAFVTDAERFHRIYPGAYMLLGGLLAPFDAWLLNRGLRTLPVRMREHHAAGLGVAQFLADHPRVRRVYHPGLVPEDAELIRRQLTGFGSLISFELDTDELADVRTVIDALVRFRIGVSWGGVESLVLTPNRGTNAQYLQSQRLPPGLVRLSVGLEGVAVLTDDLGQALAAL